MCGLVYIFFPALAQNRIRSMSHRVIYSTLAVFSLGAAPAHGAEPRAVLLEEAASLRDTALADSDALRHVASLTTEVGPRPAGSAGDHAAVEWALANLAKLGLDDIRQQAVEVPAWERGPTPPTSSVSSRARNAPTKS
jgi:hypothetical protein